MAGFRDKRTVTLGSQPVKLVPLLTRDHIFATGDRPSIIHLAGEKVMYSPVNLTHAGAATPFATPAFPYAIAVSSDDALSIGTHR